MKYYPTGIIVHQSALLPDGIAWSRDTGRPEHMRVPHQLTMADVTPIRLREQRPREQNAHRELHRLPCDLLVRRR